MNRDEMLEVAGQEDHLYVIDENFVEVAESVTNDLVAHICENIC